MTEPVTNIRSRHGQTITDAGSGDCLRACISYVLSVPNGEHMPNPHEASKWFLEWKRFFGEFGLDLRYSESRGPIWKEHPWIASVPSKNFPGVTHAIVMCSTQVEFDPSPKRRYRKGRYMLGKGVVLGGYWLEVADVIKLKRLVEWRAQIMEPGCD